MFRMGKLNPQINLEYKLLRVGIPSRYSEYLLVVKSIRQKKSENPRIEIDKFGIELINLMWN